MFSLSSKFLRNNIAKNVYKTYCSAAPEQGFQVHRLAGEHEGIVIFGLNRPAAKNAINSDVLDSFFAAMDSVRYDKSARVVILRSLVPGIFCAGADLKARAKMRPEEVAPFLARSRTAIGVFESLPMPVLVALDGHALGGGLEMALAGDMRVAASSAKIGLTETKLAIIPGGGGTQRLPRAVGIAKAKELIFTSAIINGDEAARIGLANYSVPQNEAGDAAYVKALEIAEKILPNGPVGVKMAKIAITRGMEVDLNSGLGIEEACYAQVIPTKDRIEGLTAFKEKRKPNFKGE